MNSSHMMRVFVLASLAALAPFAIDTYLPAFHVLTNDLETTPHAIQQSLTFYLFPYAVMTLFHGAISDAIGRIGTIKIGLGIFILGSLCSAFANNVEMLWLGRILQGVGGGAGNVVARAMVRDLFQGHEAQRVMATIQMLFGIAPAIAPMIGGLLLGIHWHSIFIFLGLYASISLIAAMKYLPETMPQSKRVSFSLTAVTQRYKTIFSDKEFLLLVIALGANFSGFFIYVLSSPIFIVDHLGLTSTQFGYLFMPTVSGMIFGSYLSKKAAGNLSHKKTIKAAYMWMGLIAILNVFFCTFFEVNRPINIGFVALYNIGMSLAMPVLSIAALDRFEKIRGTASSGQAFIQMLLSTVSAGLLVPFLWFSPLGLSLGMMVYFILSILVISQTKSLS
jgi:DHA1 family bicyclomycin/chloramphenicol resistance-like MFS transporter